MCIRSVYNIQKLEITVPTNLKFLIERGWKTYNILSELTTKISQLNEIDLRNCSGQTHRRVHELTIKMELITLDCAAFEMLFYGYYCVLSGLYVKLRIVHTLHSTLTHTHTETEKFNLF